MRRLDSKRLGPLEMSTDSSQAWKWGYVAYEISQKHYRSLVKELVGMGYMESIGHNTSTHGVERLKGMPNG
jgi:hypothetical protein